MVAQSAPAVFAQQAFIAVAPIAAEPTCAAVWVWAPLPSVLQQWQLLTITAGPRADITPTRPVIRAYPSVIESEGIPNG
jgi:hypothetical protein